MKQKLTLHKAKLHNLPWITDLFARATAALEQQGVHQWDEIYPDAARLEADIRAGELYLMKLEGRPAAVGVLNRHQDEEYGQVAWRFEQGPVAVVHRLCVDPDLQGQGLGKQLMALLEQEAARQGHRTIRLDAFVENQSSNRLYQGVGYRQAGEVRFRKGRFVCYEKQLCL